MREESQAAMRMLRRAIWNVRVAGPEEIADLAKELYDLNMHRFKVAFDASLTFEEVDVQLNVSNADFRRTRSAFVLRVQRVLGNGQAVARQTRTAA